MLIYVFYFSAAILVLLGWQSLRGGISYLEFFRKELAAPPSDFAPFCSIIAPCRGLDDGLDENLAALFRQNFPKYEIIFVVDDAADAAVGVIKKLIAAHLSISAKLVIAPIAVVSSQKVENLREAVRHVSDESQAFVFVDSDARPNQNWLRNLIAPLQSEKIGAATGYRWFISRKNNFASELRVVWNASIASSLGANQAKNFCWGGATAMRRDVFERLEISEKWRGTLSDDFTVTRILKAANLPIYFVPQALTATVEDCNFSDFAEFSTRQMKITRVYAAHLWKASLVGSFVFSAVFWTGIALLFVTAGVHFWLTFLLVGAIFWLGAGKSLLRLKAVRLSLKDYDKELKKQILPHIILWTITPLIYFYNSTCALCSRKIVWRGINYELKSATETDILSTNKS